MDCKVQHCKNTALSRGKYMGYCRTHGKQMRVFGCIRTDLVRNRKERNKITISGGVAEIELYDRFGNVSNIAFINTVYVPMIAEYKWTFDGRYVLNRKANVYLPYVILGIKKEKGVVIDHIDHNGLNNCKDNLRVATHSQNMWNSKVNKRNRTGVKGVSFCPIKNKWRVVISENRRYHHVGYFLDFSQATKASEEARFRYHKDFACAKEGL